MLQAIKILVKNLVYVNRIKKRRSERNGDAGQGSPTTLCSTASHKNSGVLGLKKSYRDPLSLENYSTHSLSFIPLSRELCEHYGYFHILPRKNKNFSFHFSTLPEACPGLNGEGSGCLGTACESRTKRSAAGSSCSRTGSPTGCSSSPGSSFAGLHTH